jgi:hypothetical protein
MKRMLTVLAFMTLALILVMGCQDGSRPISSVSNQAGGPLSRALQTAMVGDFVWNDVNMNGIQDPDEPGMADITVNLYDCEENMIATTVTDEDGFYAFEELEAGEYRLQFVAPDDYEFSPQDEGDDDELDSDANPENGWTECFALEADTEDPTRDAGIYMVEEEGCTYGKGFWKNHAGMGPQEDLVTDLLPLWLGGEDGEMSINVETAEMAYEILGQHVYGHPSNGITRLYAHLLTAKLNIANGADDEDIAEVINAADDFLGDNDWNAWDELSQEDRQMVNQWKGTLEDYNEGEIGPGHCGDSDVYAF